jgi:hypothetical protein
MKSKREEVSFCQGRGISHRCACNLLALARSSHLYPAHPKEQESLSERLKSLRQENPRFGSRRLHALLNADKSIGTAKGNKVNYKRVERKQGQLQTCREAITRG